MAQQGGLTDPCMEVLALLIILGSLPVREQLHCTPVPAELPEQGRLVWLPTDPLLFMLLVLQEKCQKQSPSPASSSYLPKAPLFRYN